MARLVKLISLGLPSASCPLPFFGEEIWAIIALETLLTPEKKKLHLTK
jgi:hypothetical protein